MFKIKNNNKKTFLLVQPNSNRLPVRLNFEPSLSLIQMSAGYTDKTYMSLFYRIESGIIIKILREV